MIAFGPISSRRLGKSLGVNNIVTDKICPYSCVYCQIGNTPNKTTTRKQFNDPEKLAEEVEKHLKKLDKSHTPDYLTFVPNGEPTLDINLGKEIRLLKKHGIPIAVISNSSLIFDEHVRQDLMEADWVSLKVDTVNEKIWKDINHPDEKIVFKKILEGLTKFASLYEGKLHTETMLAEGYNDAPQELEKTASFVSGLKPDIAFLSVPARPPAIKEVKAVPEEKLTEAWEIFNSKGIKTEVITGFEGTDTGFTGNAREDILNITAVHPLREDSIAELLKKDKADRSVLQSLLEKGLIKEIEYNGKTYYVRSYY